MPIERIKYTEHRVGNYIQCCGAPLSEYLTTKKLVVSLKSYKTPKILQKTPIKNENNKKKRPSKRKRQALKKQTEIEINKDTNSSKSIQTSIIKNKKQNNINWYEIMLLRICIFYKNPRAIRKNTFPNPHWLNYKITKKNVYLLWKAIFKDPIDYGNNIFLNMKNKNVSIKYFNVKIKKMSDGNLQIMDLLERTMKYHQKRISYTSLLSFHCPLSSDAVNSIRIANHLTQTQNIGNENLNYNLFTCHYTPYSNVTNFVKSVIFKLFCPLKLLLGSDYNIRRFNKKIQEFVELKRKDTISIGKLMEKIKIKDCTWLRKSKKSNSAKTFQEYQKKMMGRLLFWIFQFIIIPLIGNFFYVTESTAHFNKIFYFRKPLWNAVDNLASYQLIDSMLEPINMEKVKEILSKRDFGFSTIRMVPKNHGVRPILNLAKKHINLVGF